MKSVSCQIWALPTGGLSRCRCSSIHFWKSSGFSTVGRRSQLDADVGRLGIEIERVQAAFAADARELGSAEGRAQVAEEPAVDPGDADFHRLPDPVAAREVGGPDRGGEAVDGVVRHGDGFFLLVERSDVGARPENFLLHRARGLGQPGPERRLYPGAVVARIAELGHAPACYDFCALLLRELVVREHLL